VAADLNDSFFQKTDFASARIGVSIFIRLNYDIKNLPAFDITGMQYLKNLVPAAGIANSHFDQVKKSDLYKQYLLL